jgi:hypothetical protein
MKKRKPFTIPASAWSLGCDTPSVVNPSARAKLAKYEPLSAERYYLDELLREIEYAAGSFASLQRVAKTITRRLRRTTATSRVTARKAGKQ